MVVQRTEICSLCATITLAAAGKIFPYKAEFFSAWIAYVHVHVHLTAVPPIRSPIIYRYPIVCYTRKSIYHLRLHGGTSSSLRSGQSWMRVIPSSVGISCRQKLSAIRQSFYPFGNPLFTTSTPPRLRTAHQIPLICVCIHLFPIYRCVTVELAVP